MPKQPGRALTENTENTENIKLRKKMIKRIPFWAVILVVPVLAFFGEAVSGNENSTVQQRNESWSALAGPLTLAGVGNKKGVIVVDKKVGSAPLEINLSVDSCRWYKGNSTTCEWNFGDGEVGRGGSVSHTFALPGEYRVVLSVYNKNAGESDYVAPLTVVVR
ncbi:MAG TPA: PKD domain-containing protein [Desulfobacterales bacterium]|nr:PKD domain-containing protein [Desulfobacterales bacterium]